MLAVKWFAALAVAACFTVAAQTTATGSASNKSNAPSASAGNAAAKDNASASTASSNCSISDLKTTAYAINDVPTRAVQADKWLKKYGPNCSKEQLALIRNNRSEWLGNADSASLVGTVDALIEAKISTDPASMSKLFDAKSYDNKGTVEATATPARPAPLVQPSQNNVMQPPLTYPTQPLPPPTMRPAAGQ